MSRLDRILLAEKTVDIERHLAAGRRVPAGRSRRAPAHDERLGLRDPPPLAGGSGDSRSGGLGLRPLRLGTPKNYGDAFQRLAEAGHLKPELAVRLIRAAGFRNVVAHAYKTLDMERVYRTAQEGPADLRAFLAALQERIQ